MFASKKILQYSGASAQPSKRLMLRQIFLSAFSLIGCLLLFEFSSIDIDLQNYLYNFELSQWVLDRHNSLTKFLFYDSVKLVYLVIGLLLLVALVFFRGHKLVEAYQQGLTIVCLAVILVPLLVGILKATTNVPCPRDLYSYGGNYPYVTVLSAYPQTFHQASRIKCFPAGHASGGFALMALFFLFRKKTSRVVALSAAITIGWVIGSYKILIGDHFLGHTLFSMIFSWLIILLIASAVGEAFVLVAKKSANNADYSASSRYPPANAGFQGENNSPILSINSD